MARFRREDPEFKTWEDFERHYKPKVDRDKKRKEEKRDWSNAYHVWWWVAYGWRLWLYKQSWTIFIVVLLLAILVISVVVTLVTSVYEITPYIPEWWNQS